MPTPQDFGLPIMTDSELFATLKAQGPIGEWAAAALLTQERATRVAQDQAMANGYASSEFQASMGFAKAEIERLHAALKAADALAHQSAYSVYHELYWQARGGHDACTVCNPEAPGGSQ